MHAEESGLEAYARVVGLQQSNLDALFLEVALGLSKVQRGVVRRGVPATTVSQSTGNSSRTVPVLPVGEEGDLIRRHVGGSRREL